MELEIRIESENAEFTENAELETARILHDIADRIENGYGGGSCMDINGNKVGTWYFVVAPDEP